MARSLVRLRQRGGGMVNVPPFRPLLAKDIIGGRTVGVSPVGLPHVADLPARLSLTGITAGYQVIQDSDGLTYRYNGPSATEGTQVIGAGTAAVNGVYTERGFFGDADYFNLVGQPSDPTHYALEAHSGIWYINDSIGGVSYSTPGDEEYPWEVPSWNAQLGAEPPPEIFGTTLGELNAGITLAGAGSTDANGIVTVTAAEENNRFVYNDTILTELGITVHRIAGQWIVTFHGANLYRTGVTSAFPWEAAWIAIDGDLPVPTVTRNDIVSDLNWIAL